MTTQKHGRELKPLLGAGLAFVAMSFFSIQDAMVKWLATDYILFQLLFVRSVVAVPLLLFILRFRYGQRALHTSRPQDHAIRATINFAAFLSYYFAITRMPLADVTAIALSAPLFMTALSGPLLGEPADLPRKLALLAGFIGVLVIVQPTADNIDWLGVAAALIGAMLFALLGIQTRRMASSESSELMVFYSASAFLVITGIIMLGTWKMPIATDFVLMFVLGLVSVTAQFCIVHSFRYAQVYVIAPFEYVTILWAIFLGWLLFSDLPTSIMLAGAAIVVGCGLYIVFRKQ
ncbi:MAG: DMT family transporter [Gammaproteobacteria bacterium]|nr:DMT family transporter [Gammaproteobacteria bacterium]